MIGHPDRRSLVCRAAPAYVAVWLALSAGGARNHVLAGAMMGGGIGCKYTALPYLALLAGNEGLSPAVRDYAKRLLAARDLW